jgi:hypothetical protein
MFNVKGMLYNNFRRYKFMLETILLAIIIAKIKGYRPSTLFKSWPIYLIFIFELIYVISQAKIFMGDYSFIKYSSIIEKLFLSVFLIFVLLYKQYISAIIGSVFMVLGGFLNNIVISANNGKMPVFPKLSYLTGYANQDLWSKISGIHVIGTETTKLKFLADIFDFGYCIMSIGDIFIRVFVFLVIFNTIKHLEGNNSKEIIQR